MDYLDWELACTKTTRIVSAESVVSIQMRNGLADAVRSASVPRANARKKRYIWVYSGGSLYRFG
jgi:hypothetical protein